MTAVDLDSYTNCRVYL